MRMRMRMRMRMCMRMRMRLCLRVRVMQIYTILYNLHNLQGKHNFTQFLRKAQFTQFAQFFRPPDQLSSCRSGGSIVDLKLRKIVQIVKIVHSQS